MALQRVTPIKDSVVRNGAGIRGADIGKAKVGQPLYILDTGSSTSVRDEFVDGWVKLHAPYPLVWGDEAWIEKAHLQLMGDAPSIPVVPQPSTPPATSGKRRFKVVIPPFYIEEE